MSNISETPVVEQPTMADSIATARKYHKWVFDSISPYLNRDAATLEVGAGHGEYTRLLMEHSKNLTVTDINPEAVMKIKDKYSQNDNVRAIVMDGIEPDNLPTLYDNIVAINIIEHIEDDDAFINNCFAALNPDGKLAVFAPAFPFLFSAMDIQAGHFRRYMKSDLKNKFQNSGFDILCCRYFNFTGFFGWFLNKLARSGVNTQGTNFQVRLFNKFVWLFRWLDIFSGVCGQSLVIVGQKIQGTSNDCFLSENE